MTAHPVATALSTLTAQWSRIAVHDGERWTYDIPHAEVVAMQADREAGRITTAQKRVGDQVWLLAVLEPVRKPRRFMS